MKVTREMLDVAMKKAVEAGLLPRHACDDDAAAHEELIRYVLQAALESHVREQSIPDAGEQLQRSRGRRKSDFHQAEKHDRTHAIGRRGAQA